MHRRGGLLAVMGFIVILSFGLPVWAIGEEETEITSATIINDEGGPAVIRGAMHYTNALLMAGTSEPLVVLEDQTGFILRDKKYVMSLESQVLGTITSDFLESPFTYTLTLPREPQGQLNDVDHDAQPDTGIMVFQVAYWTNKWGDAYLEERDLFGGGWSGSYSSAQVSSRSETLGEYTGGKILIYAPEAGQTFPSGFGSDAMLFTADDPLVYVPQGYTLVDMDQTPFIFDRSREPVVDLIESEDAEADDFSGLGYTAAFDAMVDKFRRDYAFTEYKGVDWNALAQAYRPRFVQAEAANDSDAYIIALQEFTWEIPDGHLRMPLNQITLEQFREETDGGLGFAIREVDDDRVIVNFLLEDGPAAEAGIELAAEIIAINGVPIIEAVDNARAWSAPFSTPHYARLQNLRYAIRFPLGTDVELTYRNPDDEEAQSVTLTVIEERESFNVSSFYAGVTGYEQPIDYQLLGDVFYARINSFFDDERLTVIQWERMIQEAIVNEIPAIILDIRNNGGGSGFLADQMAAYFFDEPYLLGNSGSFDEDIGDFYFDPDYADEFILPPDDMRYHGEVVILVGPNCASACEFFAYDMTFDDRATIIGHYPTAGLGGSVEDYLMPEGLQLRMTVGRAVDPDGNIHIEGVGVVPDIVVPVTEETVLSDEDAVLRAALDYLQEALGQAEQE